MKLKRISLHSSLLRSALMFIILLSSSLCLSGQSLKITGRVFDALSENGLEDCKIQVLDTLGHSLATSQSIPQRERIAEDNGAVYSSVIKRLGAKFTLRVAKSKLRAIKSLVITKRGYEPINKELSPKILAGKRSFNAGDFYLFKKSKTKKLDEVVVKATKIKMLYKGDTIVYNADAFNITQMDKLKVLVAQLPNAEFDKGVLKVNGRVIQNMTISGKDFFNGNINAVLENLPAYIVSKLKVFEKAGEMSELTGRDMHDKVYTMDVKLKRQYLGTWNAKIGAEAGTRETWSSHGLLMRMDDRQMLTATFDANNLNIKRKITEVGTLIDNFPKGRREAVKGTIDYFFQANKHWRIIANASVEKSKHTIRENNNTQTFLQARDLISRSENLSTDKLRAIKTFGALRYRKGKQQHKLSYEYAFNKQDFLNDMKQVAWYDNEETKVWNELPLDTLYKQESSASTSRLLSSLLNPRKKNGTAHSHKVKLASAYAIGENLLKTNLNYHYTKKDNNLFENYALTHYQTSKKDWQRRYLNNEGEAQKFNFRAEYEWRFLEEDESNGGLRPYLDYSYSNSNQEHNRYRLDKLKNFTMPDWTIHSLGVLPDGDFKEESLDRANSYDSKLLNHHAGGGLQLFYKKTADNGNVLDVNSDLELYYAHHSLDYNRNNQFYPLERKATFFAPKLRLNWKEDSENGQKWISSIQTSYTTTPEMADLFQLLPIKDESDPLNIFLGNKDLKNPYNHQVRLNYSASQRKSKHSFSLNASWTHTLNQITMLSEYNSQTGVRSYTPQNSDRSYSANASIYYTLPIDKSKKLWLTTGLSGRYYQGEILARMDGEPLDTEGLLQSRSFAPSMRLKVNIGSKFRAWAYWQTDFQNVQQTASKENYRTTKFSYDFNWSLPWDFSLSSRIESINYSGYKSSALNRTSNLWTASLGREFKLPKGILFFDIKAYDILGEARNLHTTINNLYRSETYTDMLPQHFLLSLTYMFDWSEKRK